MIINSNTPKGNWTTQFADDDALELNILLKGELDYRKNICKISYQKFNSYLKDKLTLRDLDQFDRKTVILVNGEIRTPNIF